MMYHLDNKVNILHSQQWHLEEEMAAFHNEWEEMVVFATEIAGSRLPVKQTSSYNITCNQTKTASSMVRLEISCLGEKKKYACSRTRTQRL